MKVAIVKPKGRKKLYDGRYSRLKRAEYVINSKKVCKTLPGHLATISKTQLAENIGMDIRLYLRKAYGGNFVLLTESNKDYIIKRKEDGTKTLQENCYVGERLYYIPKRKARHRKVGGE